jgi:hypothetical protein
VKKLIFVLILLLPVIGVLAYGYGEDQGKADGWTAGYSDGFHAQQPVCPVQHHYKFEVNGASIYRFDLDTGESCMLQSNQIDKWSLGRCPN